MKFVDKDEDTIASLTFSSGRRLESSGVLGLSLSEGMLSVCDCWDQSDFVTDNDVTEPPLTPAERRELAEFMIERWTAFGEEQS